MVGLDECIGIAGEPVTLLATTLVVSPVAARVIVEMGGMAPCEFTVMDGDVILFAKLDEDCVFLVKLVTTATVEADKIGTTELSAKVTVVVELLRVSPVDETIVDLLTGIASFELMMKGPVELAEG